MSFLIFQISMLASLFGSAPSDMLTCHRLQTGVSATGSALSPHAGAAARLQLPSHGGGGLRQPEGHSVACGRPRLCLAAGRGASRWWERAETVVLGQGLNYSFLRHDGATRASTPSRFLTCVLRSTIILCAQRTVLLGSARASAASRSERLSCRVARNPVRRRVAGRLARLGQKLEKKARSDRFSQK